MSSPDNPYRSTGSSDPGKESKVRKIVTLGKNHYWIGLISLIVIGGIGSIYGVNAFRAILLVPFFYPACANLARSHWLYMMLGGATVASLTAILALNWNHYFGFSSLVELLKLFIYLGLANLPLLVVRLIQGRG